MGEFADHVGQVAANFTFAIANKEGDTLCKDELTEWIGSGHASFQVVALLVESTLYTKRKDRQALIEYLSKHHTPAGAAGEKPGLLELLKRELVTLSHE